MGIPQIGPGDCELAKGKENTTTKHPLTSALGHGHGHGHGHFELNAFGLDWGIFLFQLVISSLHISSQLVVVQNSQKK